MITINEIYSYKEKINSDNIISKIKENNDCEINNDGTIYISKNTSEILDIINKSIEEYSSLSPTLFYNIFPLSEESLLIKF